MLGQGINDTCSCSLDLVELNSDNTIKKSKNQNKKCVTTRTCTKVISLIGDWTTRNQPWFYVEVEKLESMAWLNVRFSKDLTCFLVLKRLDLTRVNVAIVVDLTPIPLKCKTGLYIYERILSKITLIHFTECAKVSEKDKIRFYAFIYVMSIQKGIYYRSKWKLYREWWIVCDLACRKTWTWFRC